MTGTLTSLLGLDPSAYQPSDLHAANRLFRETNCYADLWIELLNAKGFNPAAAMAAAAFVDFERDQWTFFKPHPDDLLDLFGIDVHEMQIYRPIADHLIEQLSAGRTMTLEVDSFYLPDTAATSYRRAHVKSSIAVEAIDLPGKILRYFHGAGYYELGGEDFNGVFRIGRRFSGDVLPPYVELVRFDAGEPLNGATLKGAARQVLRRRRQSRPKRNPWRVFRDRLARDMQHLLAGTETYYHNYAFATVRQCGGAFELAASFCEWLTGDAAGTEAARLFARQAGGAKTLLFKLARRRSFDPGAELSQLAEHWDAAMDALDRVSMPHCSAAAL